MMRIVTSTLVARTLNDKAPSYCQIITQQQLVTALVLCLVTVSQTNDPRQAALASLHQLLQIEHDSLALDSDGQGSQCMGCGIARHVCAWKVSMTSHQLLLTKRFRSKDNIDAGQGRSKAEAQHVVHDVQGCRVYRACQNSQQRQHHACNQAPAGHHSPTHTT